MTAPAHSDTDPRRDDRPTIDPSHPLATLTFDNRFVRELPADPEEGPGTRQVPGAAYSRVQPVATAAPRIIAWSPELSSTLGLEADVWATPEAAQVFTGNALLPGSEPHAANYGGHQFGNWAGQLGDGRAIALGEVVDRHGVHQTLQLKGAGPTPYSRRADGLAVLRSSIREYLCSEAMHHLGVPTTRALSLASTGTEVMRDMFYDGRAALEPGAVVCRVAPSFLRFGTYQLPVSRGELDLLRALADFTIRHYFRHLLDGRSTIDGEVYAAWFAEVGDLTCELIVEWMRVGFVHGVMNTDNLSIHGLTIDYGPYGWLDDYDPNWTPNTTDAGGRRYRFGYQPQIAQWNLLQLGNALLPLVGEAEPLEASINGFVDSFRSRYRTMMLAKLGLEPSPGDAAADDELIDGLGTVLTATETDMTIFFRRLAELPMAVDVDGPAVEGGDATTDERSRLVLGDEGLGPAFYRPDTIDTDARRSILGWVADYRRRVLAAGIKDDDRAAAMNTVNPCYVLRNYLAQLAIDAAEAGDHSVIDRLATVLRTPYDVQPGAEDLAGRRPDWARTRPGCSMLSCSS